MLFVCDLNFNLGEKTNIILVDNTVKSYEDFVSSCNSNTLPIVYSKDCNKQDLLNILSSKFTSIDRIALVFDFDRRYKFLDNKPLFLNKEVQPYSDNLQLIVDIIKLYNVKNIDYLACDTLKDRNYKKYYEILKNETNVIVGASKDKTGNIKYGGNWTMETTGEDIELIYFTKNIEYHKYLLGLSYSAFIIKNDRSLWATGFNGNGELGLGDQNNRYTFTQVTDLPSGKKPETVYNSYNDFTILLMNDGTVYGTGYNDLGSLGDGTNDNRTTFEPVSTMPPEKKAKAISVSEYSTFILMTDGTVWGCGGNYDGELGIDNQDPQTELQEMDLKGKKAESIYNGSYHTIVLMTDGTLYGCGSNGEGQLGLGEDSDSLYETLQQITLPKGKTVNQVACGADYTILLMTDGTVYGCGYNYYGQLGLGNGISNYNSLTKNNYMPSNKQVKSISGSYYHTVFLMTDGTLYGCGDNEYGCLGFGQDFVDENYYAPTQITLGIPSGMIAEQMTTGYDTTYVKFVSPEMETAYGTGYNDEGQLAQGEDDTDTKYVLTQMRQNPPVTEVFRLMNTNPFEEVIPNAPICFPAGSLVLTDQGYIKIEKVLKNVNTINGEKIVAVTKTIPIDEYLVMIPKDRFKDNVPSKDTYISKYHKIFYNGKMITAKSLSEKVGDIYRVNYNKEILYNILLEKHSTMYVNNLLVETLDPNHVIAKLYNTEITDRMRNNIIVKLNKSFVKENKMNKSNKFKML